jgi:hypothetical protein
MSRRRMRQGCVLCPFSRFDRRLGRPQIPHPPAAPRHGEAAHDEGTPHLGQFLRRQTELLEAEIDEGPTKQRKLGR